MHTIYKYILATCLLFFSFNIIEAQVIYLDEDALESQLNYAHQLCQYIEKDIQAEKELDRKRIRHLTNNGVLVKWFQAEEYSFSSGALDYLQMKLQYETFKSCQVYRDRFHLLFDAGNIKNAAIVQKHQEMIAFLNAFENRMDLSNYSTESTKLLEAQKKIYEVTEAIFFQINYLASNDSYEVGYYLFTPESEIRYPMDAKNKVMKMTFALKDKKLQSFEYELNPANYKRINPAYNTPAKKVVPAPAPEPVQKN